MDRRTWAGRLIVLGLAGVAAFAGCRRRPPAEVNDIVPSLTFNRSRVPLGSPVEVTYNWTVGPTAKKVPEGYHAFVHFLDSHQVMLIAESHLPVPPPSSWEPGKTYSYTRTTYVPVYPYVGEVEVRIGVFKDRQRIGLKLEDKSGMQEYSVAKVEFLPQTENIFLVYKDGWHSPESTPDNPSLERTWTKKEALVSFKNPKKDVLIYLEADTNTKVFPQPPVLTISAGAAGLVLPIENSEVFTRKIRVKAADLGSQEWVDLKLAMNQSFVPKLMTPPLNQDERELGLMVYHLWVGEEDKLGSVPAETIVDAGALPVPAASPAAKTAVKAPPAKAPAAAPAAKAPAPKTP